MSERIKPGMATCALRHEQCLGRARAVRDGLLGAFTLDVPEQDLQMIAMALPGWHRTLGRLMTVVEMKEPQAAGTVWRLGCAVARVKFLERRELRKYLASV